MLNTEPDEPVNLVFGYYDDWYRRDMAHFVLEAVDSYQDWELETIIAAQAIYASNFLNPN